MEKRKWKKEIMEDDASDFQGFSSGSAAYFYSHVVAQIQPQFPWKCKES